MVIATPFAIAFLIYLFLTGDYKFATKGYEVATIGVIFSGLVTVLPLFLFLNALPKLKFSIVGFLQYITPSLHFVLAITILGESINLQKLYVFIMIWVGLVLFMVSEYLRKKKATLAVQTQ